MRAFVVLLLVAAAAAMIPDLTKPDVNVDTDYYYYYDAKIGRNVTVFETFRINSVLAWGLKGDNGASPGGEIGFITEEYGQTTGYIIRYCVEVVLPEGTSPSDLEHGSTNAFGPYECCDGGSCSYCGYQGSGTNTNPQSVGRSFNLDKPYFAANMAKEYGWWYSFNNAGYCEPTQALNTSGCTYRASPYVGTIKLEDINVLNGWVSNPSTMAQWQTLNNMMVNAFSSDLMTSFTYNPAQNKYTQLTGRFRADPSQQCRVSCPLGTYSTTGFLDAFSVTGQCAKCPTGTYADTLGSTSCTPCPQNGQTTNGPGAVSSQACFTASTPVCQPGSYNPYTGHSPCTPCPANTYQSKHSATTCNTCPSFSSSSAIGASSSSTCQLAPPQAQMFFYYTDASTPGTLASTQTSMVIAADVNGEIGFLQTNNWGETISTSGTVSYVCVESVNEPFYTNQYSCWGSYCNLQTNTQNLPINGTSGQWTAPVGQVNGQWYEFPQAGECSNQQLPGQGGCTWKASTLMLTANLGNLMNQGFYSCQATNPLTYCYNQLTPSQWQNSTNILQNFANYATLNSTITTSASGQVYGPVTVENGRCVVQCPAGYTFRSAFTAPYCVPSSSSSFLASDYDVESTGNGNNSQTGAVVGASVAAVAVVAIVAAVVAFRIKRRHHTLF